METWKVEVVLPYMQHTKEKEKVKTVKDPEIVSSSTASGKCSRNMTCNGHKQVSFTSLQIQQRKLCKNNNTLL